MKYMSEMHQNMLKTINVFFDDHINGYLMLKRNSKYLSKVNIIMTKKYIKYRVVNWKVCKYLWKLSAKTTSIPRGPRNIDIPLQSSVKHKETSKYFWLRE